MQCSFLGNRDQLTDLGVWSGDTTRIPAPMHNKDRRGLFLEIWLSGGRFAIEGGMIALTDSRTHCS